MVFRLFHLRIFEWTMTAGMLGLAVEMIIWPNTIGASAFRLMTLFLDPGLLTVFFLVAGVVRVVALIANGRWPKYGPRMRAFGAALGALIWAQMDMALLQLVPLNNGIPSPGIPIYFALTFGEIVSCYRALTDDRSGCR